MNIQFGSGVLFGKPVAGNQPVNPTPFKFGVLQEVDVTFKGDLKKLYGQNQFAVATARGKIDVMIKGKIAVYDVNMLNQLFFAQAPVVGYDVMVDPELHTLTVNTVTMTNVGLVDNWGVQDATTGQTLTAVPNVAALTATGLYYVNLATSVYSFNSGDIGRALNFSYSYNQTAKGSTIPLTNQLMGYAPELKMFLYNNFRAKYLGLVLNDVTLGQISLPSKLEDFWISDFDGNANADASNSVGKLMCDLF